MLPTGPVNFDCVGPYAALIPSTPVTPGTPTPRLRCRKERIFDGRAIPPGVNLDALAPMSRNSWRCARRVGYFHRVLNTAADELFLAINGHRCDAVPGMILTWGGLTLP
jgi:hypothetical protein